MEQFQATLKTVIDFFHAGLELVRPGVERIDPVQRFACDLRSVDRLKKPYGAFARSAGWEVQAVRLDELLAVLWRTGDPGSAPDTALRSLIPDAAAVDGVLVGTAQSVIFQLEYAVDAGKAGSVEAAMKAVESSYDTAYMHAQESDDSNVYGGVRITQFGSAKFADDAKRWLAEVQLEVDARAADLRDPRLPAITSRNFGSFRVG